MGRTTVQLTLIYHEIARRLLLKQDPPLIAISMCIPEDFVKQLMRRPAFREVLAQLEQRAFDPIDTALKNQARNLRDDIDRAAANSFDRLTKLLQTTTTEGIIRDIGQDFLDRAGYGKIQKVEQTEVLQIDPITADVLVTALKREQEGKAALGDRIPVKPSSEADHPIKRRMQEFDDLEESLKKDDGHKSG